jgi:hypothetical protein
VHSVGKVSSDEIRLILPLRGVPEIFAFAVTSAHQDTAGTSPASNFYVTMTIANDERVVQVDGVFASRAVQHTRLWLSAVAAVSRSVRAVVYGVETGASGFELLRHEFVDRMDKREREIPTANAGLICNHDHRHLGFVEAANRIRNVRQDTKSADVIQVTDFFGDSAVAIEKNAGAESSGFRQGAPPSKRSTVARRLRRHRESRASCIGDPWGSGVENKGCNKTFPERCCNAA